MSKYEKFEKENPDVLQNPKLAESMRKAKKKEYRKKLELEQKSILAAGIAFLIGSVLLPCVLSYSRMIPFFSLLFALMAHGLFYIVLMSSREAMKDNEPLFYYNNRTDSHEFITGSALKTSHFNMSLVFLLFSWFGLIIYPLRFDTTIDPLSPLEIIFTILLMGAHIALSAFNIYSALKSDNKYIENLHTMKTRNK